MNIIQQILQKNEIIESARLKIYPCKLETQVLVDLWEIYSDRDNVIGFSMKYNETEEFAHLMMDKVNRHQNELFGYIGYIIELKETGKIIGIRNIILDGVYNYQNKRMDNNENVIVEIVINKKFWKQSYAWEASNLIFDYLADNRIKRVGAFLNRNHIISQNMCEKMGFQEVTEFQFTDVYKFNNDHEILHLNMNDPRIMVKILNCEM